MLLPRSLPVTVSMRSGSLPFCLSRQYSSGDFGNFSRKEGLHDVHGRRGRAGEEEGGGGDGIWL